MNDRNINSLLLILDEFILCLCSSWIAYEGAFNQNEYSCALDSGVETPENFFLQHNVSNKL